LLPVCDIIKATTIVVSRNLIITGNNTIVNTFGGGFVANLDIRRAITYSGLRFWEVAAALGCTDSAFSRRLRRELPQPEKEKIFSVVQALVVKRGEE
jgi:hypothetical protein